MISVDLRRKIYGRLTPRRMAYFISGPDSGPFVKFALWKRLQRHFDSMLIMSVIFID